MNGYLTVTETATYLNLHRNTVLRYINQGKLPAVKLVRVWRIPREHLDNLIKGDDSNAKVQ